MKKLLFTSLLALGLLLPTTYSASTNNSSSTEFSTKKPRKSSSRKSSRARKVKSSSSSSRTSSRSYSKSNDGCTYNGHQLYVGSRGGCYYYSGSSKKYVERAYCASCN
jgi:hypothetical protein